MVLVLASFSNIYFLLVFSFISLFHVYLVMKSNHKLLSCLSDLNKYARVVFLLTHVTKPTQLIGDHTRDSSLFKS
jgi:hypothetical protein